MAAAVGSDIDSFIREQKAKLATERQALNLDRGPVDNHTVHSHLENGNNSYRKLWSKMHLQAGNAESMERKPRKMREDPQSSTNVYEEQKKKLQAERRQEMQTFLQQQKEEHHEQGQRRQWNEPREGKAIPDSDDYHEAARKRLAEDRKREYQEMRDKSAGKGKVGRREWEIPETASAEQPLRLGQYERTQQQLQKERQEDYKKMLQSQNPGNRSWREPSQEKLLPLGENEGKRKEMEAERNQEYNEYLKSKQSNNRTWREPSAEKLLPLGGYDQKRRMNEEERKREYQEFLKKEEEAKLMKAFGNGPIPGTWKGDQQHQHTYPSSHWEKGRGEDEFSAIKQNFPDSYGTSTLQRTGEDERRTYDWLQPSRPKEQQKKVRMALDQPLFPDDPAKNITMPSVEKKQFQGREAADSSELLARGRPEGYEDIRRRLQEERGLEYNQMLERKRQEESQREFKTPSTDSGLFSRLGSRESQQSRLREERHREYNEMLERKKQPESQRERKTPSVSYNIFSGLGSREGERDRLREERHREYNEMLERKKQAESQRERKIPSVNHNVFSSLESTDGDRDRLDGERRQEHYEMLERKKVAEMQRQRKTPPVSDGFFSHLGSREGDRERLREERHQEYKEFLKV